MFLFVQKMKDLLGSLQQLWPYLEKYIVLVLKPWSYLEKYFALTSRNKRNPQILYFRCIMCHPKETTIKGQDKQWASTVWSHISRGNIQCMPLSLRRGSRLVLPVGNANNLLVAVPVASRHGHVQRMHSSQALTRHFPKLLALASISLWWTEGF